MSLLLHPEEVKSLSKPCSQKQQGWHSSCLRHLLSSSSYGVIYVDPNQSQSDGQEDGGDMCGRLSHRWVPPLCQCFLCFYTQSLQFSHYNLMAAAFIIWVLLTKKKRKGRSIQWSSLDLKTRFKHIISLQKGNTLNNSLGFQSTVVFS